MRKSVTMEWVRGESIGRGSFGTVNLAKPRTQIDQFPPLMAVKSCGSASSALLLHEKSILEELRDCQEVIQCYGGDFSYESGEKFCNLFLEYGCGGDLERKVKNSSSCRLPEIAIRRYTRSILKGLKQIHEIGYVHCDLKLQNIVLCSGDIAKIADFGLAKRAGKKASVELRGTPLYMSPETVSSGEQEAPADLWALGCLVAEMATGAPAWKCSPTADICGLLMKIAAGDEGPEIPNKLSSEGKDFLSKCFMRDPAKRWTAEMLLNHQFLADDDSTTVPLEQETCDCEASPSESPRGPFDWESDYTRSSSSLNSTLPLPGWDPSTAARLRQVVTEVGRSDWSESDSWITVR